MRCDKLLHISPEFLARCDQPSGHGGKCTAKGQRYEMTSAEAIEHLKIPAFTALDWFKVTGRGDAVVIELDRDYRRSDILESLKRVEIDGKTYDVSGFEADGLDLQKKGTKIALLIADAHSGVDV